MRANNHCHTRSHNSIANNKNTRNCSPCFDSTPVSSTKHKEMEVVCNNICGNFLLQGDTKHLTIWEEKVQQGITVSVTVFNSAQSDSDVEVLVRHKKWDSISFTVPPGNSLSRTVEDVHSVTIIRTSQEKANGNFCLDVCFVGCHKEEHDCPRCNSNSCHHHC